MARYVYVVETNDEGCVGIFGQPGKAIRDARENYEAVFPRGSVAALKAGEIAQPKVAWDEAGDLGLMVSRREVL